MQPSPQSDIAGTLASYCSDSSKAVIVGSGSTDEKTDTVLNYVIHRVDLRVDMLSEGDVFPKQAYELPQCKMPEMIDLNPSDFVDVQPMVKEREGSTFNFKSLGQWDYLVYAVINRRNSNYRRSKNRGCL